MEAEKRQYIKMTTTPVPRLIVVLAIPTIISMLVTNIYNTGDTFFVSKLGTSASGAIGIVFAIMAFYQAVGFMCGQGAGSFVSRFLGAKKIDDAKAYASTGALGAIILSLIITVLGFLFMNPFLRLLGATETILPFAREYAFWVLIAGPFLSVSCVLNNILRYEGKAFYAMIALTAGGILNLAGDPILIFGLDMGVSGAGIATAFSQMVSCGILYFMFMSGKTTSKIDLSRAKYEYFIKVTSAGFPSLIRQCLAATTTILLNMQAKPYGDSAIAAMSVVGRIGFLIASVAVGLGQGLQPVAAFNYGAKKYGRVKKAWAVSTIIGTVFLSGFALYCLFNSETIISWFRNDEKMIEIGAAALRWTALSCLASPFAVSSAMLLQSTGKSKEASFLALLKNGILFVPLILILPNYIGISGVEMAQPLADILTAVITIPLVVDYLRRLTAAEKIENAKEIN